LRRSDDPRTPSNPNRYFPLTDLDQSVPQQLAQRFCAGDCAVTKNFSLVDPGDLSRKYYALGIGVFLEVESEGSVSQLDCNFDARCVGLPQP